MENKPRFKNGRICKRCGIEKHISLFRGNETTCTNCYDEKNYENQQRIREISRLNRLSKIIDEHLRDIKKT